MNSYTDLFVWQKSMDLVESVYRLTAGLPDSEKFNLISQMQRSAVSIPSNIAEGHDRKTNGEFSHFLRISLGSSAELETQLAIALRLNLLDSSKVMLILAELTEVRKMLSKLISSIAKS